MDLCGDLAPLTVLFVFSHPPAAVCYIFVRECLDRRGIRVARARVRYKIRANANRVRLLLPA